MTALPKTASKHDTRLTPSEATPTRRCIATGESLPVNELVRFVLSPDGIVTPDIAGKLPGRGVWVHASRDALATAIKTHAFNRGFKSEAHLPDDLVDMVESLLLAKCQSVLGFARKAGDLVTGSDKVRAALSKRKPAWLIEASDGGEDGRKRLYALAKALYESVKVAGSLSSRELGMALGRDHVVHGLLKQGRFASVWAIEYGRLRGFRDASEDRWFSNGDEEMNRTKG